MKDIFDISKFDSYKEDNRREVKKANGGLPVSLWDTLRLRIAMAVSLFSVLQRIMMEHGERQD